jgi:RNA polymerase sigma-70 factor (ECF subfamily)
MRKPRTAVRADAATDRFEELFRAHHAAVAAYVGRRAPAELVDDVVGETFLVAWRRLEHVPDQERPWLFAVARNTLATQRRGAQRRRALTVRLWSEGAERAHAASAADCVTSANAEGVDHRLAAAMAQLAPKEREALMLIAWDGLEPQEAALVLGESPSTFRVRLHRARQRVRKLLGERPEPALPASGHRLRVGEAAHD